VANLGGNMEISLSVQL